MASQTASKARPIRRADHRWNGSVDQAQELAYPPTHPTRIDLAKSLSNTTSIEPRSRGLNQCRSKACLSMHITNIIPVRGVGIDRPER